MTAAPHPYLDNDGPVAFAHRGGLDVAPENTMAAFADAVSLGFRYVETDVHVTSDGVLVAFHDDGLLRTCGIDARIEDVPWDRLRDARVDGREPIPLLDDLLGAWPGLRVNIDCKSAEAESALSAALRRHNCLERVCIGSFSDRRLGRFRAEFGPQLCTSSGPREIASLSLASRTTRHLARTGNSRAAQVPVRQGPLVIVTPSFIDACHRRGMKVHVWTVNDPVEMARLLDLGVDGIMSDDIRALRDVFSARGLW